MPTIHFLNVDPGDCMIIQHVSGHVSMIDICDGNLEEQTVKNQAGAGLLSSLLNPESLFSQDAAGAGSGNFKMNCRPTNPIKYVQSLGITNIFRFVLTHPDMDHMDGLKELADKIGISNFWDTGYEREKPDFNGGCYREEDWDAYEKLRSGNGAKAIRYLAGSYFKYANESEDGTRGGDGLYILAPDSGLIAAALAGEDPNDASYVLLYRSAGGRVLLPGDAHDATWEYVLENYEDDVANCSVMVAPHHGRHSDRYFDFLDRIEPKLTLFGNAPSEHLAYDEWNRRGLPFITSNQAGNIVLEAGGGVIKVYVENESFAKASGKNCLMKNNQGYVLYETIQQTEEVKAGSSTQSLSPAQSKKPGVRWI